MDADPRNLCGEKEDVHHCSVKDIFILILSELYTGFMTEASEGATRRGVGEPVTNYV